MTELSPRQIEVNAKIDAIVAGALQNSLPPFAVRLIDTVLRPYAHALDWAEENGVGPDSVSFELANVVASMVTELATRTVDRKEGHKAAQFAQTFANELAQGINVSLDNNFNFGAVQ